MYLEKVENELNVICMWLSMYKQTFVILGDLNLDRLKPETREGKILKDLEEIHSLEGMITTPTRITNTSATLLDVTLTNKPEIFTECGTYEQAISDHLMITSVYKHKPNVISFRSTKNLNIRKFNEDLRNAP